MKIRNYWRGEELAKYNIQGCFTIEVEAKDYIDARETAQRILRNDGIKYLIIDVARGKSDCVTVAGLDTSAKSVVSI
jgi:hypothetical protein